MSELRIILHAHDFRETEIRDLRNPVFEENIRWLKISMRHILIKQALISFRDLIDDIDCLAFRKTSLIRVQHALQIPSVAEFQNQVDTVRRPAYSNNKHDHHPKAIA